jgi:small-conductance mechanosensitive channel
MNTAFLKLLDMHLYKKVSVLDGLVAVLVVAVAFIAARLVAAYMRRAFKDKIRKDNLEIAVKLINWSIVAVAVIYALGALGFKLSGLMVAGGIAGVVIGFASQSIVGNLISGIFLMIERPIKIGDQVSINDYAGFVEDIRIISTTLRTFDGLFVRIPNEKIFTAPIVNYVNHIVRRIDYTVGIRYSDDADKAIAVIKHVIDEYPFALKYPEPVVFVETLGDNCVTIAVRIWAPVAEWYGAKKELLWRIKTELEREGMEIPFPQRVVWFGNELQTKPIGAKE